MYAFAWNVMTRDLYTSVEVVLNWGRIPRLPLKPDIVEHVWSQFVSFAFLCHHMTNLWARAFHTEKKAAPWHKYCDYETGNIHLPLWPTFYFLFLLLYASSMGSTALSVYGREKDWKEMSHVISQPAPVLFKCREQVLVWIDHPLVLPPINWKSWA